MKCFVEIFEAACKSLQIDSHVYFDFLGYANLQFAQFNLITTVQDCILRLINSYAHI